jgi:hypothetical protein
MGIETLCMDVLTANEIGGNLALAYRFSDPDGERTGKSGYSFGRVQFDIENNWTGILALKACGFRPKDLDRLFEQRDPIADLNAALYREKDTVDEYDRRHVAEAVEHCRDLMVDSKIRFNLAAMVHLVDYHNQLYLSPGGPLHRHLAGKGKATPKIITDFKRYCTAWGRKRPDDVLRRAGNIDRILKGAIA